MAPFSRVIILAAAVITAGVAATAGALAWMAVGQAEPLILPATSTVSASSPITVAAAGEIACDPTSLEFNGGAGTSDACGAQKTAALLAVLKPDLVLVLGDVQGENDPAASEDANYDEYLRSYERAWGPWKARTFVTAGEEDDRWGGGAYYRYFGRHAGPQQNQTWFSLDVATWHIVSLNSNCDLVPGYEGRDQCRDGSAQEEWLQKDLAASDKECSLLIFHRPRWSAMENFDELDQLIRDFYDANGEILLSAHDHAYERFAPQSPTGGVDRDRGMRQFVVGTGGEGHELSARFNRAESELEAYSQDTFGVLELTLEEKSYRWRFVPEVGKAFRDAGDNHCHD